MEAAASYGASGRATTSGCEGLDGFRAVNADTACVIVAPNAGIQLGHPTSTTSRGAAVSDAAVTNVRVKDQAGGEMVFKIKAHTPMRKLLDAFCVKKAVAPTAMRLVFDGQRLDLCHSGRTRTLRRRRHRCLL